jgi:hypothetical protein
LSLDIIFFGCNKSLAVDDYRLIAFDAPLRCRSVTSDFEVANPGSTPKKAVNALVSMAWMWVFVFVLFSVCELAAISSFAKRATPLLAKALLASP